VLTVPGVPGEPGRRQVPGGDVEHQPALRTLVS
jgi:hypothetical protein